MNHVQHLISEYMDETLTEKERMKIEEHLQICKQCKEYTDEWKVVRERVSNAFQFVSIPNKLESNVISFLEQRRSLKLIRFIQTVWYGIPVFFLMLLFSLLVLPAGNFSVSVFHVLFNVGLRLLHVVPVLMNTFPSFLFDIILFTGILIFISGWSLRRLLSVKVTG